MLNGGEGVMEKKWNREAAKKAAKKRKAMKGRSAAGTRAEEATGEDGRERSASADDHAGTDQAEAVDRSAV